VKGDREYLLYVLECIAKIEEDVCGGRAAFEASRMIQDAVIRNLQIMAESAKRVSSETKSKNPQIDWIGITGLRNVLVHDYFKVDVAIVWRIVEQQVPELKAAVEQILALS